MCLSIQCVQLQAIVVLWSSEFAPKTCKLFEKKSLLRVCMYLYTLSLFLSLRGHSQPPYHQAFQFFLILSRLLSPWLHCCLVTALWGMSSCNYLSIEWPKNRQQSWLWEIPAMTHTLTHKPLWFIPPWASDNAHKSKVKKR